MTKTLGLEYSGKQKWCTYEMLSQLKWKKSKSVQNHCPDDKEDIQSGRNK